MTKAFLFALLLLSTTVFCATFRQKLLNQAQDNQVGSPPVQTTTQQNGKGVAKIADKGVVKHNVKPTKSHPDESADSHHDDNNEYNLEHHNEYMPDEHHKNNEYKPEEHDDSNNYKPDQHDSSDDAHNYEYNYENQEYHENYENNQYEEKDHTVQFFGQDFLSTIVAVCTIPPHEGEISGSITFTQVKGGQVSISAELTGLKPKTSHGFHVHEFGDLSNSCANVGVHFNPFNDTHGGPKDGHRQNGDLGNIMSDKKGNAKKDFKDRDIQLSGPISILGRAMVIHQDMDDFGKGGFNDSKTVGHSGAKIACCVIGFKNLAPTPTPPPC
jgi:Cu-Zn family superoxide dismutase